MAKLKNILIASIGSSVRRVNVGFHLGTYVGVGVGVTVGIFIFIVILISLGREGLEPPTTGLKARCSTS